VSRSDGGARTPARAAGTAAASARSTPTVLGRILESTRAELRTRERAVPGEQLRARALEARAARAGAAREGFRAALSGPGIAVIAEFKRRSPSAGELRAAPDRDALLAAYARGGARALSVLTEGPHFGGTLEDLREARRSCALPVLRKDFILDDYQLHEALLAGADAVLLIVAALDQPQLAALHGQARELGLDVLVEVHDRAELARALALDADLIGVNNRDLRDFSVEVRRTLELRGEIPAGVTVVSESGIARAGQLRELESRGVDAVLVGEALMRATDPEAALRALLNAAEPESPGL
jgi:indole-3-glycerol phosphate synthase